MEYKLSPQTRKDFAEMTRIISRLSPAIVDVLYGEMTIATARAFARHGKASNKFRDKTGKLRKNIRAIRINAVGAGGRHIKKGAAMAAMFAPHAHFIESGTADRVQSSTGRATGQVQARNVMGEAFDTQQGKAGQAGLQAGARAFGKMVATARSKKPLPKALGRALTR